MDEKKEQSRVWFTKLRDMICAEFERLEDELAYNPQQLAPGRFQRTAWQREGGGGGEMSVMKGRVFEKVGVNISTVFGEFSPQFAKEILGAEENPAFYATGISLVAHMYNPRVPSVHMNTRFIVTSKSWFGGGADLTPSIIYNDDNADFHTALQSACDKHDPEFYPKYKQWCDEYFFIKHRNEARGIGGIFYDYLEGDFDSNFAFTKDVGLAFLDIFPKLVRRRMNEVWSGEDKESQLIKRGRYAEFNLVYDRGTKFGLMTGGNVEAILMSLPPEAKWP